MQPRRQKCVTSVSRFWQPRNAQEEHGGLGLIILVSFCHNSRCNIKTQGNKNVNPRER
jgi:hypothetical protein